MKAIICAAASLCLLSVVGCRIEKVQDGRAPAVDPGKLPEYRVEVPDIEVKQQPTDVTVPDIDLNQKKARVNVPDVDVKWKNAQGTAKGN